MPRHIDAVNKDAALIRLLEPGKQAQQRRLAGTGATEQGKHLPRRNVEVQRINGGDVTKSFGDAPQRDGTEFQIRLRLWC